MLCFLTFQCCVWCLWLLSTFSSFFKNQSQATDGFETIFKSSQKACFLCFLLWFFSPLIRSSPHVSLAAQLLRPWPSWCCNASSLFSFDPLFPEFPWSPACEPHILQLDASAWSCWLCPCSAADLARSFFYSKRLEDHTRIEVFILRAVVYVSVITAINAWIYKSMPSKQKHFLHDAKIIAIYSNSFS